jgi:hypothetical protein
MDLADESGPVALGERVGRLEIDEEVFLDDEVGRRLADERVGPGDAAGRETILGERVVLQRQVAPA